MDHNRVQKATTVADRYIDQLKEMVDWKNAQIRELEIERNQVKNYLFSFKQKLNDPQREFSIESLVGHVENMLYLFEEYDNPIPCNNQVGAGNALVVPAPIRMNATSSGASEGPDPSFQTNLTRSLSSSGTSTTGHLFAQHYSGLENKK